MSAWQRFLWADDATEAAVAVVADDAGDATTLLQRLGPTEDAGSMTFDAALDLQGSFYDDGTFDDHPSAAAFALIERWTGVTIIEAWFLGEKPTFVVQTATP